MTLAWLRIIHTTIKVYGAAASADEFVDGQPQLKEKKILRLFYSPEVMMSARAKREFVEPDLAPLPLPMAALFMSVARSAEPRGFQFLGSLGRPGSGCQNQ